MIATDPHDSMLTPEEAEMDTETAQRRGPMDRLRRAVMMRLFDDEPAEPEQLGRYTVESTLGSGGMGTVYAAHDPQLDRKVALKVLNWTSAEEGGGRLLREAKALARLSHPNVVQVHDAGKIGDQVFLTMELVEGTDLRRWFRESRSWTEVTDTMLAAGEGLAAAHEAGLVHRDFKPENVLVRRDGLVKVADFGLVRDGSATDPARPSEEDLAAAQTSDVLTRTGSILGTPAYMSPEQHLGLPTDARTDQFSFCIALYEGLYGKRPFVGESLGELIGTVGRGQVEFPKRPRVPAEIVRVLERGLQPDVEARYPDMRALLEDLRRARRPKRTATKLAAATLVGVAAVAVYLGPGQTTPSPTSTCDPATKADGVWNDEVRLGLKNRFADLAPELADNATHTAHATLDDYFRRWVEAYETTCAGDETQEAQRLARRLCLQSRLDEASGVVEVLREADADMVANVAQITAALGSVEACLESSTVVHVAASDPAFSRDLVRVRALWNTRQAEAALELATDLAARAQRVGDRAIEADARFLIGMLAIMDLGTSRSDLDPRAQLSDSLEVAQVLGDPRRVLRAEVLLFMFPPEGQPMPDFETLRTLEPRVMASDDALAQWAFHYALASQLVVIMPGMDPTEPRARAEALLELSRASFGPGHRLLARAEDLARRAGILEKETPEAAVERAKDVEAMFGADSHAVAQATFERAVTLLREGDGVRAREMFEQAIGTWTTLEGPESPHVGRAWRRIAWIEKGLGNHLSALEAVDAAIEALKSNPESVDGEEEVLSSALAERAQLLLWLDRPKDALVAVERSERHRRSEMLMSMVGDVTGRVRAANGDLEGALRAYDEGLRVWDERIPHAPAAFPSTLPLVAGKAETLLAMGRREEAREVVEPVWTALQEPEDDAWYEGQRARLGSVLARSLPPGDARVPAIVERSLAAVGAAHPDPDLDVVRRALEASR